MKFEDAFHEAGTFGLAQKWMVCICLIIYAYSGWPQTTLELIELDVPFQCVNVTENSPATINSTTATNDSDASNTELPKEENQGNLTIFRHTRSGNVDQNLDSTTTTQSPVTTSTYASHLVFYDNNTNYTIEDPEMNRKHYIPPICYSLCENVYEDKGKTSIFSSFNLGCLEEKHIYETLLRASSSIGLICSCFITGIIADAAGRRSTLLPYLFLLLLALFLTPFAPDIKTFIALKTLIAFFSFGALLLSFIATIESCAQKNNPRLSALVMISINIGHVTAAIVFNYVTNWRVQMYVMPALLPFIIILVYAKMPESARWLNAVGRISESEVALKKIADDNGRSSGKISLSVRIRNFALDFTENEESLLDSDEDLDSAPIMRSQNPTTDFAQPRNINLFDLFGTSRSALVMMFNIISWICIVVTWKHLTSKVKLPSDSPFMTIMFIALVQTSCILISFPLNSVGRKYVCILSMLGTSFLTTTFLYCQSVFGDSGMIDTIAASLVAQMAVCAFVSFYLYTAEQMPAALRCTGLSLCIGLAETTSLVATLAPEFPSLQPLMAPLILCSGLLAVFLGYFFGPETKHRSMPHTVEQFHALVE